MQCTSGNSGCFPLGKASSQSTALPQLLLLLFLLLLCALLSCLYTAGCEAYPFTTDGYGIFNVRTHLGACVPYPRRQT